MAIGTRSPDAVIDIYLGQEIRRRRRELGMTQHQLADACGVRFQQIQKYESGANRFEGLPSERVPSAGHLTFLER